MHTGLYCQYMFFYQIKICKAQAWWELAVVFNKKLGYRRKSEHNIALSYGATAKKHFHGGGGSVEPFEDVASIIGNV